MSLISSWKSQTNMNRKPAVYHWICCCIPGKIKGTWTTERVLGQQKGCLFKGIFRGKKTQKPKNTQNQNQKPTQQTNKPLLNGIPEALTLNWFHSFIFVIFVIEVCVVANCFTFFVFFMYFLNNWMDSQVSKLQTSVSFQIL